MTARIVDFLVRNLRSFNVVAQSGFVDLISFVAPDYPLVGANYYSFKIVDKYALTVARLQDILGAVPTVSITVDLGTLQANHAYLEITATSLTPNGI